MAGFIYWAPRVGAAPDLEKIKGWGLGYAFAKAPAVREADGGLTPSKGRGFLFADKSRLGGKQVKIESGQVWRKMPFRDGLQEIWIGYWEDAAPTPEDLARPSGLAGFDVTMADGRVWQVPLVRSFDEEQGEAVPALPTIYDLDADGNLVRGAIQQTHRWLWELTEPYWQAMVAEQDVTDQESLADVGKLLSANYAVSAIELVLCGVFAPRTSPAGLMALAIDYLTWRSWRDAQKKTTSDSIPAGCSTSDGSEDGLDATPPPVRTS